MARSNTIRMIRTTRAALNAQAIANNLVIGEPYFITDEDKFAIAKTVSTYSEYSSQSPLGLWDYWQEAWFGSIQVQAASGFTGINISGGASAAASGGLLGYNRFGILLRSSTTANGGYRWYTSGLGGNYFGVIAQKFRCAFSWQSSFTGRNVRIGYADSITVSAPTDGAYFDIADNIVYARTSNNGSTTTNATTATLTLNVPYVFDVEVDAAANNVRYRIYEETNETPIFDETNTTNIPKVSTRAVGAGIVATEVSTVLSDIGVLYMLGDGTPAGFARARG